MKNKELLLEIAISTNKQNIDALVERLEAQDFMFKDKILFTFIWQVRRSDFKKQNEWYTPNIRILAYNESGLSKSRNRAIENAIGDILLFSDDDVLYQNDIYLNITEAYNLLPNADIITFKALTGNNKPFKNYPNRIKRHSIFSAMKVSSWEITAKTSSLKANNLFFNENFGLGSDFPTAEENLFVINALRKGMNVFFYPKFLVIHPERRTSSHVFNEKLIKAKGAFLYEVFSSYAYLYSFLFTLKKFRFSEYSFWDFYILMIKGMKELKKKL